MIPIVQAEMAHRGWLSSHEFGNLIAVSEVTPGSVAINTATFVGYRVAGVLGGLSATLGLVLPSLLVVLLASVLLVRYGNTKALRSAFVWVAPAVVGLVLVAGVYVAETCLFNESALHPFNLRALLNYRALAVFGIAALCLRKLKVPVLPLMALSATLGVVLFYWA